MQIVEQSDNQFPCNTCMSTKIRCFSICATTVPEINSDTGVCEWYDEATPEKIKKWYEDERRLMKAYEK